MWQILLNPADRVQLMRQTLPGLSFHGLEFYRQTVSRFGCSPVVARMDSYQSDTQTLSAVTGVRQARTCEHSP